MLRASYPNVKIDELSDDRWVSLYAEWKYCERQKYEILVEAQKEALSFILNELFKRQ
nr:MAG TPA: hypothetical protein [Caudoviricetes sp.]